LFPLVSNDVLVGAISIGLLGAIWVDIGVIFLATASVTQQGKASNGIKEKDQLTCWRPNFSSTLVLLYCPSQYGTTTYFFSIKFGAIAHLLTSLNMVTHDTIKDEQKLAYFY
jgi:hypothetical protein